MGVVLETTRDNDVVATAAQPVEVPFSLEDFADPELTLEEGLEILVRWASSVIGSEDAIRACEEFAVATGKVFHDDAFYDSRMTHFLDHYLFERNHTDKTPFALLVDQLETSDVPAQAQHLIRELAGYRHGLFLILKASETKLLVRDLETKEKIIVMAESGESFTGFGKKDIFQGFLFPWRGVLRMSRGLIIHPKKAGRVIRQQLKKAQKSQEFSMPAHLCLLARKQLRYLRHRHVDPRLIYQHDPR